MPVIEVPIRAQTRRRVRLRLPAVVVMWVVCVLGTSWVATATAVGPVVYTFTTRRGIHLADLALAALVAVVASVVTWFVLRPPSRRSGADDLEVVAVELRRIPLIIATWLVAMVLTAWVGFETEIGPVLFVYNNHRSVRLGEVVVAVVIVTIAARITAILLRPNDHPARVDAR